MLYVALAEGRLRDYVVLCISTEVIFFKDTVFSDINAASRNAKISSDIEFFLNLPFDTFHNKSYKCLSEQAQKNFQSEVLVKNKIEQKYILN